MAMPIGVGSDLAEPNRWGPLAEASDGKRLAPGVSPIAGLAEHKFQGVREPVRQPETNVGTL